MELFQVTGMTIKAVKGSFFEPRKKSIKPTYILFDDGITYIELREQDYYQCHDCWQWARAISVYQNKEQWEDILKRCPDANDDFLGYNYS